MTSALRWAAMRAILMFHNCEGQSHKTVSTNNNFWRERRAEADSNRGASAYQTNALPLDQTGSQCKLVIFMLVVTVYAGHFYAGGYSVRRPFLCWWLQCTPAIFMLVVTVYAGHFHASGYNVSWPFSCWNYCVRWPFLCWRQYCVHWPFPCWKLWYCVRWPSSHGRSYFVALAIFLLILCSVGHFPAEDYTV